MDKNPRVEVFTDLIRQNSAVVVELCRRAGISILGVTKACCGDPAVARAMLDGGVAAIGDSRLENLRRLRDGGIEAELWLIRLPRLSQAGEVVETADVSLNSEMRVINALGEAALKRGIRHKILLMVDVGDLREGVLPRDVTPMCREILQNPGVELIGLGTNLTCFGGIIPSPVNLGHLARVRDRAEDELGIRLQVLSGGNSSSLPLVLEERVPRGINHLRIGEGILLGNETVDMTRIPGTRDDAFRLWAEIVEIKRKPSVPIGEQTQDAFGEVPEFEDRGVRTRAILAIGRQDVDLGGLRPADGDSEILGASSDHLVLDITESRRFYRVGQEVPFLLNYSALLSVMTSPFVKREVVAMQKTVGR